MSAQLDNRPGLFLFLSLLAAFGGLVFPAGAEEKPAPEQLPLPTEVAETPSRVDALGDSLPPGVVMRLGSARWRHGDRISAVAYSQDGKRIASAVIGDESVRICDAENGKVLHHVRLTEVQALALSRDGKSLAAIGRDTSGDNAGVWLWKDGAEQPLQLLKKTADARCLLFHERQLWVGHRSGLWFCEIDGKSAFVDLRYYAPTRVNALAISGGTHPHLAVATDQRVLLADWEGKRLDDTAIGNKESATSVAFAPDGNSVAVGTDDGSLYAWSIRGGGRLTKRFTVRPPGTGVTSITYSPDGKQLISVCHGGEVFRWNSDTGEKISKVVAKGGPPVAKDAIDNPVFVLSADGTRLAGRFGLSKEEFDSGLHVWDATNGEELSVRSGPGDAIQKMAFQSDGSFVSLSTTGELIVWNTKLGRDVRRELMFGYSLAKASLSTDGRVALFSDVSSIEVSNFKTHARPVPLSKERQRIYGAAFCPDRNLFVASYAGSLGFWSLKDKSVTEVDTSLKRASTLTFSGNGKRLLLADGESVQVWNVAARKKICELKKVRADGPIALSAQGEFAAVCSTNGGLRFFDANSGEEFPNSHPTLKAANDLLFMPVGRCLLVATEDGVRFFEPLLGLELSPRLDCRQGAVTCLAINRDGTLLATGGADSTVLLWDVHRAAGNRLASLVERMPVLPAQRDILWNALASPDSATSFAAASGFLDGGKGSVAYFRDRMLTHEKPFGDAEQQRLLRQLADPDYKERAKAFVALKQLGRAAEPMLREAFRTEKDEIMHIRLRAFLAELELDGIVTPKDERVRETQVVQLLGLMATPPARELLTDLAHKGASEQLRKDAAEKLQRLKGRASMD